MLNYSIFCFYLFLNFRSVTSTVLVKSLFFPNHRKKFLLLLFGFQFINEKCIGEMIQVKIIRRYYQIKKHSYYSPNYDYLHRLQDRLCIKSKYSIRLNSINEVAMHYYFLKLVECKYKLIDTQNTK